VRIPQSDVATGSTLRLHYNENTAGCSPAVVAAIRSIDERQIASYPDVVPSTTACARYLGVAPEYVHLTNGLDEGIQVVTSWARHASGERAPHMIVAEPTFEMYGEFAAMVGARLTRLDPLEDFRFPLDGFIAALSTETRAIFLTDPNNPTGVGVPTGAAETLAEAAPDALVLVDEAYADFSGRTLVGPLLDRRKNVVIGRTFAKGHGLAGLRIGAVVAHPDTIEQFESLLPPFNVNICALKGLEAALGDKAHLSRYVAEARRSRELVYAFCRRHAFNYWPSEANFVLIRLGDLTSSIVGGLEARGIVVRDKSGSPGCDGCIRLTAGVVAHTETALAAMEDVLASRAN
jgi:histidinol-phosphate aminotransferase